MDGCEFGNTCPQSYQEVVLALSRLGRSLASELTPTPADGQLGEERR